jgi:hypothetical protein
MRKTVIDPAILDSEPCTEQEWSDLEKVAKVEVTSEDPSFPLDLLWPRGRDQAGGRLKEVSRSSA